MSDLDACFPAPAEIGRLAENAAAGRREPFVGTGDPDTILACPHGTWRLGDILDAAAAENAPRCSETTKSGDPCKGRPGEDGLCAAHKEKGGSDVPEAGGSPQEGDDQGQDGAAGPQVEGAAVGA